MSNEAENNSITSRCCVCGRKRVDDQWLQKSESGSPAEDTERVSHTYCPPCLTEVSPRRRTSGRAMLHNLQA